MKLEKIIPDYTSFNGVISRAELSTESKKINEIIDFLNNKDN